MPKKSTEKKTASKSNPTKKSAPKRASRSTSAKKSTKKAAPKKRKATKKKAKPAKAEGDQEVTIDRRRSNRREEKAETPKLERREKVNRRRQIDPTTCERDYSDQEVEFMNALDDYKRSSGRMFPTCSEVLEVIRGLGYVQLSAAELALRTDNEQPAEESFDADNIENEEALEAELVG